MTVMKIVANFIKKLLKYRWKHRRKYIVRFLCDIYNTIHSYI